MRIDVKSIILSFLMLALSLSVATNSLNGEVETASFEEIAEPLNVILPIADLNVAGFQEGSIFSDTTLSSGNEHSCAILDDGSVSCWGYNNDGQLGDGTTTDRNTPTQTSSLGTGRTAIAISSGFYHTCAILDDASVSCWGRNIYGELGDGTTTDRSTPTQTSSLGTGRTAIAISSGGRHTCALLDDGSVSCWGDNYYGQLGDGTATDRNTPTQTSSLGTGGTAVAISSGEDHTCALLDNGSVICWGGNSDGQLGDGTNTDRNIPTQTSSLGTGRTAVAISSEGFHTCAVLDNGSVSCWGRNYGGQLGDGTTTNRYTPTQTSGLGTGRTAVAISSGGYHTCALLDNGSVSCWGDNSYGPLGDGTYTNRNTPTQTSSLGTGRTAVAISSGTFHSCAVLDDGSVSCWGYNAYSQLGDGTTIDRNTPTQTSSLGTTANPRTAALSERDFDNDGILNIFDVHHNLDYRESAISSGYRHTCAILDNGSVSCWGENSDGRLGDGTTTNRSTPTQTSSLGTGRTAVAISSGKYHTCAILDDGSVSCWGNNALGQLGDGTTTQRNTPTQTSSLGTGRTAVAISSGSAHTCAILDDGSVSCWGFNNRGRLGDGTTTDRSTPTQTSSLGTGRTAVAISSAYQHTCIILDDGTVSCWGANGNGQLGDGTTTPRHSPTQTSSLGTGRTAVAISTGGSSTCAILDDGTVSCWGVNGNGQLGDGTTTNRITPAQTSSLGTGRTAVALSSGGQHTCAILDDASVSCWGSNSLGELGDGTTTNRNTPNQTSSLGVGRTAVAISSGSYHTCAILDDGTVSCWGDNGYGQLGDGTGGDFTNDYDRNTPTQTSNLGTGRTALLVDGDTDRDGTLDHLDDFPNNSIRSIACMSGQYGRYVCVDAPIGKYVSSNSAMYATDCLAGTYQATNGQSSCTDAAAGYYVSSTAQSSQTACSISTYQALTGQASCDDSTAGYYVSTTAQSSQTACSIGTYQALTGQISCDDASAGYYVSTTGQSSQTACLAGTFNPSTGSTSSSACGGADVGYYVSTTAQTNQTACSAGTYQALTGQASCDDATAGYYVSTTAQSSQTACLAGTYNPNIGSSSSSACGDADAGYYVSSIAQSSQTACLAGTYNPNTGSISSSACGDADVGHYVPSTAQSNQTACSAGTYQALTGQASCDAASQGYYVSATAQTSQTACSIGTYQATTGQSSCENADAGYYVSSIGQSSQTACLAGTYQALTGQASCNDADSGYYVSSIGQSSQTACLAGTYNPNTGSTVSSACGDADAGYYVSSIAQSNQTACSIGTYQALTGQTFCDDADVGNYVSSTGQSSQTACSIGTYQTAVGETSCDDADVGYYVSSTAQSSQTACAIGTYQVTTGQSSCGDADAGYYVSSIAQSIQTACLEGTYNPNTGSISSSACANADAGYYVPITGQSSQTACATGTYQALTAQSSCDGADAGYYVSSTGQSSQTACASGTYQADIGETSCDDADVGQYVSSTAQSTYDLAAIGYYVPFSGSSNQTACPPFTSTSSLGSQSIDDCTLDTDLDSTPDSIDADDDNDGTLDGLDAFPLDYSEDTDTDGNGVGDILQTKQEAKFQTQMLRAGGIVILLIVIGALIFFKRKNSIAESIKEIPAMESNVMGTTAIDVETPLTHPSHLQSGLEPLATPDVTTPADQVDAEGYEWLTHSDGTKWYRVAQSNSEWTKFE